jgi:hypothetical protein
MTKSHLSPAEAEALKAIEAAEAAGKDPFGDLDDDTAALEPDAQASSDPAALDPNTTDDEAFNDVAERTAAEAAAQQAADGVDESVLNELADPLGIKQPAPTAYAAEIPAELDGKRTDLMTEKAEALEKLMSGEIEAKDYAAVEIKVANELAKIDRQISRAETLAEINQQTSARYEGMVIAQIVDTTKPVLDYTKDAAAQRQFDVVMAGLRADPANAAKSFADLASDANKTVLAIRGLSLDGQQKQQETAQQTQAKPTGTRMPTEKPPATLRGVPVAATPNTGGGVVEQMANLSGAAFEAGFQKLSPAQQAALLGE